MFFLSFFRDPDKLSKSANSCSNGPGSDSSGNEMEPDRKPDLDQLGPPHNHATGHHHLYPDVGHHSPLISPQMTAHFLQTRLPASTGAPGIGAGDIPGLLSDYQNL